MERFGTKVILLFIIGAILSAIIQYYTTKLFDKIEDNK